MSFIFRFLLLVLVSGLALISVQAQDDTADFVEANVDRTSAYYVGEPILYTWRWFLMTNIDLAATPPDVRLPSFAGFGRETLNVSTESAIRNGKTYQVITQQIVLYAYSEGTRTLDPIRIVIPETPFTQNQTLQSAAVQVIVQPVPENAPPSFENAVGQFDLTASLDRSEARTGEPLTLTMTITGSGNGPVMYPPRLSLGSEWRQYPEDVIRRQDGPLLGEAIFTWTLIPLQPGTLTLPSQAWSFLNPQTGQYETRTTQPFMVTVTGDPITQPESVSAPAEPTLYPLHSYLGFSRGDGTEWTLSLDTHGPRVTYPANGIDTFGLLLGAISPTLAAVVWCVGAASRRRHRQSQKQTAKRKRSSVFQDRLAALASASPQEVARGVQNILHNALCRQKNMATDDLDALMQGLSEELQTALRTCFDTAEAARYAPFTTEDAKHLIQDAQRIIRTLEAL